MAEAQMLPWDGQLPLAHLLHLQLHRSMNAKLVQSELYVNVSISRENVLYVIFVFLCPTSNKPSVLRLNYSDTNPTKLSCLICYIAVL